MALTQALLKANSVLAGLTDEQIAAIVTLSTNDEATVIGQRIGELHGQYDNDVLSVTGIAKNQSEKTYDYVKRVLGEYKTKLANLPALEKSINDLKQEKTDLEKQIRENTTDAALKQKLADTEKKLTDLQGMYDTDKANFEAKKVELEGTLAQVKIENHFDNALSSLKFKASIPESVRQVVINSAKQQLLTTTKPEFVKGADGKESLIFRDANGQIMNNPENKLNPYSAAELLKKNLSDIIDVGQQKPGTGSKPGQPNSNVLDLSGARTQVEADEAIQKHLLELGYVKTKADFSTKHTELRKELEVDKLPIR